MLECSRPFLVVSFSKTWDRPASWEAWCLSGNRLQALGSALGGLRGLAVASVSGQPPSAGTEQRGVVCLRSQVDDQIPSLCVCDKKVTPIEGLEGGLPWLPGCRGWNCGRKEGRKAGGWKGGSEGQPGEWGARGRTAHGRTPRWAGVAWQQCSHCGSTPILVDRGLGVNMQ